MITLKNSPIESPLGKKSSYIAQYQSDLLFPIPRKVKRDEIGIPVILPFKGCDIWNAYEISWLNKKGKPIVALGEFIFSCESPNLIESKSFKLYLNSFNNTQFDSVEQVIQILKRDLSEAVQSEVMVAIVPVGNSSASISALKGICLDNYDVSIDTYVIEPKFLHTEEKYVSEVLYSDLLKSNCLVTGQPDWGSVQIEYSGKQINHVGLLKYIVSFRDHNEFHEQCVERIFIDLLNHCQPQYLSVQAHYTRRGGLDINPFRATDIAKHIENRRLCRQ